MKRHLKRLAAPAKWNIQRRSTTFVARPMPSGHSMDMCIPLNIFMKEIAGYAKTTKEVKTILQNKNILVNGRKQKDHRAAAGFLDIIEMDAMEHVRIILDARGKIGYVKVSAKEAHLKVSKIIGKTALKGNKLQLNLNDGQNFLISSKEKYNVGDSVVVDVKTKKIIEHLPFDKNMTVLLVEGKQIGRIGKIMHVEHGEVTIKLQDGAEYKTKKGCAFVVGKEHPAVTVQSTQKE